MEPALDPEATQSEPVDAPDVDFDAVMDTAHLARFEFSDAGTKVLMVEWTPAAVPGQEDTVDQKESTAETGWQISWAGKSAGTFLRSDAHVEPSAAAAAAASSDAPAAVAPRRRVFFLLPPPAPIPTTVALTPPGGAAAVELKPLPAIFPEGFMDVETGQGTRGVLHTIWAKQRVRELEREMDAEMRANAESVGLDMAAAERQWIVDTFLRPPPAPAAVQPMASGAPAPFLPRTPTGGRLGEKLKGLRLGTSPTDLAPSHTANTFTIAGSQSQTLSPQGGDIAVSSFASMARQPFSSQGHQGPVSLDAALRGDAPAPERSEEDDLFALPMSPRSPEMAKSPFSILR